MQNAWRAFNEEVTSPVRLVEQLEQAELDKSYHYADCSDQEEKYDCQECRRVTEDVYQAKKQLEACPEAKAIYDLPESLARRRQASREYLRYVEVRYPEEDY
jgi:hypothetical protein